VRKDRFIAKYELLKAEKDVLLFMDEVHPTQAIKVTCGWIRTGVDKTLKQREAELGLILLEQSG